MDKKTTNTCGPSLPHGEAIYRKNKLLSTSCRRQMFEGFGFMSQEMEFRSSGRTTGIALATIGEAMSNPGKPIPIKDHHGNGRGDHLIHLIYDTVCLLKLEHLVLSKNPGEYATLTFEVFEQVRYRV